MFNKGYWLRILSALLKIKGYPGLSPNIAFQGHRDGVGGRRLREVNNYAVNWATVNPVSWTHSQMSGSECIVNVGLACMGCLVCMWHHYFSLERCDCRVYPPSSPLFPFPEPLSLFLILALILSLASYIILDILWIYPGIVLVYKTKKRLKIRNMGI